MGELTLDQQKAVALANGRRRAAEAAPKEEGSWLGKAVRPIAEIPEEIGKEYSAGAEMAKSGMKELTAEFGGEELPPLWDATKSAGKALLGGAKQAFSPITGATEALVGNPIYRNIPEGTPGRQFVHDTATALGGMALPAGAMGAAEKAVGAIKPLGAEVAAARKIITRMGQDEAGGKTAQTVLDETNRGKSLGKPVTLADTGGENVRGLASHVARAPGPSQAIARNFLNERDVGAPERLLKDTGAHLATGSVREAGARLLDARSAEGKALFEKAHRGGSMAPLEQQYQNEFAKAADEVSAATADVSKHLNTITTLRGKLATNSDIYVTAKAQKDLKAAEEELAQAQERLNVAQADKSAVLDQLKQSQADRASGAPGAVWNPRIDRMLKLPIVRQGIQKGITMEMQEAAAEFRAPQLSEYAIVGQDANGEYVVGKVPNMKLLSVAKEGLDGIVESLRDPITGILKKEGVAVDKVRRALLAEMDAINPDYAVARQAWAGKTASFKALDWGRKIFGKQPEDIAAEFDEMTESEKEFARLGVADIVRERVLKTAMNGDEAKHIVNSAWARQQLRPMFASEKAYKDFVDSVTHEGNMFETRRKAVGGSETAERALRAEEEAHTDAGLALRGASAGAKLASGQMIAAVRELLAMKRDLGLRSNPKLNEAIARLLFDPSVTYSQIEDIPKLAKINAGMSQSPGVNSMLSSIFGTGKP